MKLYLFEYCYEDGQRWEVGADSFEEALEILRSSIEDASHLFSFRITDIITSPAYGEDIEWLIIVEATTLSTGKLSYSTLSCTEKEIVRGIL